MQSRRVVSAGRDAKRAPPSSGHLLTRSPISSFLTVFSSFYLLLLVWFGWLESVDRAREEMYVQNKLLFRPSRNYPDIFRR